MQRVNAINPTFVLFLILLVFRPGAAAAEGTKISQLANTMGQMNLSEVQQHAFDFHFGAWQTHIRLLDNVAPSKSRWIKMTGVVVDREIWGGAANIEEIRAYGSHVHFEGLTLFLYNPKTQQWYQSFASKNRGMLGSPLIGHFSDGRGIFIGLQHYKGKLVLIKGIWSHITANSYQYEESESSDGGRRWHLYFEAHLKRVKSESTHHAPHMAGSKSGG